PPPPPPLVLTSTLVGGEVDDEAEPVVLVDSVENVPTAPRLKKTRKGGVVVAGPLAEMVDDVELTGVQVMDAVDVMAGGPALPEVDIQSSGTTAHDGTPLTPPTIDAPGDAPPSS
ncbi:MAG: hypothetical protein AB2A00_35740, partial [Myxococcota bacterium]